MLQQLCMLIRGRRALLHLVQFIEMALVRGWLSQQPGDDQRNMGQSMISDDHSALRVMNESTGPILRSIPKINSALFVSNSPLDKCQGLEHIRLYSLYLCILFYFYWASVRHNKQVNQKHKLSNTKIITIFNFKNLNMQ